MYDELVKALRETDFGDTCVLCEHEDMCKGNDCIIIQAADAIESMSEAYDKLSRHMDDLAALMPRWIPVSEKLPDGRDSILALTGDCDFYVCDYIPSVKQFWTIPGDELHIDDITHWMPLPEPPKEET